MSRTIPAVLLWVALLIPSSVLLTGCGQTPTPAAVVGASGDPGTSQALAAADQPRAFEEVESQGEEELSVQGSEARVQPGTVIPKPVPDGPLSQTHAISSPDGLSTAADEFVSVSFEKTASVEVITAGGALCKAL